MLKFHIIFGFAVYIFLGVSAVPTCSDNVKIEKLLEEGNAAFTGSFLYESLKNSPRKNIIMSPFSVFILFGELALYAEGETRDQLLQVLNLPTQLDIRCVFKKLTSNLKAVQNVILKSKFYSTQMFPLSERFLRDTKDVFNAEAEDTIKVSDPNVSANKINRWVTIQINQRTKNFATPYMITPDTGLILVNAIRFLGNWNFFDKKGTKDRIFYLSKKKKVLVPTMYQQRYFKYGENSDLDCKVLEMDFADRHFSFLVFLPNKIDGLKSLVGNLQDQRKFYNAYDNLWERRVNVRIPKIKTESEFDLTAIMKKVGIVDILKKQKSNLPGILKSSNGHLFVSAAKQKVSVEVSVTGTTAAAAHSMAFNIVYSYKNK